MTQAAEYWQYAEEALRGASESKSDTEKQVLVKLARLWSQAALKAEVPSGPSILTNDFILRWVLELQHRGHRQVIHLNLNSAPARIDRYGCSLSFDTMSSKARLHPKMVPPELCGILGDEAIRRRGLPARR